MPPRSVSTREIARHNGADDCWLVVNNQVWDLSDFAPNHPGGAETILRYAGRDATAAYNEVHGPATIKILPATQLIGQLDLSSVDETWTSKSTIQAPSGDTRPPLDAIFSAHDFEDAARSSLSKKAWAFYSSAATDLISHAANQSFYRRIWMRPRLLQNVLSVNTQTTVLGAPFALPVIAAPVALARLAHPTGEKGIASAAASKSIGYCIPITASFPAEEITATAPDHPYFFQLYVNRDRVASEAILHRIWGLGVRVLFVTIDTPVPGKREADERVRSDEAISMPMTGTRASQDHKGGGITRTTGSFIDETLCWDDLAWVRAHWRGRLVLKGVQSVEDALMAVEARVDGIVLSNHGGRNLDTAPPALLTLLELGRHCPHVLRETEVFVDGGIRRGTDILKAICLGARAVLIGRPVMYALSYGKEGVEHLIDIFGSELQAAMKLVGITDLSQAHRGMLNTQDLDHLVVRDLTRRAKI
ncbi:cytochrome B2 [Aspergillus steynii IBT 23096]|uniref:L-lactate dehydrogenase (cytochrome) n=1 Tax=Aspergillus steynii IBT 23096 TaxID=1392250 RepID=A0A2I2GPT3_9EURO|nr:cytochrome B2 [Aspergillus steynii IBT 23096]PLB54885.1 cytochrome B2 [Aspergillus steynii IBT 23096]